MPEEFVWKSNSIFGLFRIILEIDFFLCHKMKMHSPWTKVPSLGLKLEAQMDHIKRTFPTDLFKTQVEGVLLTGSCSQGKATYRSDIDFLVILKHPPLTYSRVCQLRDQIESKMSSERTQSPLGCEFHFVLMDVFSTREPAMAQSLLDSVIFIDPNRKLKESLTKFKPSKGKRSHE